MGYEITTHIHGNLVCYKPRNHVVLSDWESKIPPDAKDRYIQALAEYQHSRESWFWTYLPLYIVEGAILAFLFYMMLDCRGCI